MKRWRADIALLMVALIWGSAFAVQRVAGRYLDPFTFNGLRFLLAGSLMLPFSGCLDLHRGSRKPTHEIHHRSRFYIPLAGMLLFAAGGLQQAGLETTTAGNAGFITSLYVIIVPLLLALFWREHLPWIAWAAAGIAVLGSLLLSTGGALRLVWGDFLELAGAVMWACHVILVGRAMLQLDVIRFSTGQYLVAGVLNIIASLLTGQEWSPVREVWWTVIYIGVLSTAIGYTLQVYGQKTAPAADAAILLSMEAVFAALTGYFFLSETLTLVQVLGCVLILVAIVLAQLRVVITNKEKAVIKENI